MMNSPVSHTFDNPMWELERRRSVVARLANLQENEESEEWCPEDEPIVI